MGETHTPYFLLLCLFRAVFSQSFLLCYNVSQQNAGARV
jgi:hypothetical protein